MKNLKNLINISIMCLLLSLIIMPVSVHSNEFDYVYKQIEKLEAKLITLVSTETKLRIAGDKRAGTSTGKPSYASKDLKELQKAVKVLKAFKIKTENNNAAFTKELHAIQGKVVALENNTSNAKIEELTATVKNIQSTVTALKTTSPDANISEISNDLLVIIAELKAAMKKPTTNNSPQSQTSIEPEHSVMELGGVVTIDYGGDMSEMKDIEAKVGTVELSANVSVAPNILASITLLSGGDLSSIVIDAAIVEWKLQNTPAVILFGQQNLGHGLMSTHLISDPLVKGVAPGFGGPSISLNIDHGLIAPFAGLGMFPGGSSTQHTVTVDSIGTTEVTETETSAKGHYRGLLGFNLTPTDIFTLRTSISLGTEYQDAVLGGELSIGIVVVDLEGYYQFSEGAEANSGVYTGAAVNVSDMVAIATRYDMATENQFEDVTSRIGTGVTISFDHGIFCAAEYGYLIPSEGDAVNEIGLQIGLKSSLKLPGFRRKTLKQGAE